MSKYYTEGYVGKITLLSGGKCTFCICPTPPYSFTNNDDVAADILIVKYHEHAKVRGSDEEFVLKLNSGTIFTATETMGATMLAVKANHCKCRFCVDHSSESASLKKNVAANHVVSVTML